MATHIPPIPMQKTLLLVNNFITNTGIFLNNFSNCCETKLSDVSLRINRIEITLSLLEAKLGSIPGLVDVEDSALPDTAPAPTPVSAPAAPAAPAAAAAVPATPTEDGAGEAAASAAAPEPEAEPEPAPEDALPEGMVPANQHPDYSRYFRLQRMGVPDGHIQLRMRNDGVDADILYDPTRLLPAPPPEPEDPEGEG